MPPLCSAFTKPSDPCLFFFVIHLAADRRLAARSDLPNLFLLSGITQRVGRRSIYVTTPIKLVMKMKPGGMERRTAAD
jgi:hypothetical protein